MPQMMLMGDNTSNLNGRRMPRLRYAALESPGSSLDRKRGLPVSFLSFLALRSSSTEAYVSLAKTAKRKARVPARMAMIQKTQRHPRPVVMKPPTTGPTTGPSRGPIAKPAMAAPRFSWEIMSVMVPPPLVMGQEPKMPLKKRKTMRAFIDGAFAQAMTKTW